MEITDGVKVTAWPSNKDADSTEITGQNEGPMEPVVPNRKTRRERENGRHMVRVEKGMMSSLTKPPVTERRTKRRKQNKTAKAARRQNRGK